MGGNSVWARVSGFRSTCSPRSFARATPAPTRQLVVQKHLDCVETALDGTFFEDTAVTSKVLVRGPLGTRHSCTPVHGHRYLEALFEHL